MDKKIGLMLIFIMFAFSFLVLSSLPSYLTNNGNYMTLIYVLWGVGFSVAFVKVGLG